MNFQEWLIKQAEEAPPDAEWKSIDEAAEAAWNAAYVEGFVAGLAVGNGDREKRKEVYRAIVQTNPTSNHFNVTRTVLLKLLGGEN